MELENLIHAPAEHVEHAQPGRTLPVHGGGDGFALLLPPGFIFSKNLLVRERAKHLFKECGWRVQYVEINSNLLSKLPTPNSRLSTLNSRL